MSAERVVRSIQPTQPSTIRPRTAGYDPALRRDYVNKLFARMGASLAVTALTVSLAVSGAVAAPGKSKPHKVSSPTCSACKMTLSAKKDKIHTVAVKIKGKTYYCCAGCPMNKSAAGKKAPLKSHSHMKKM